MSYVIVYDSRRWVRSDSTDVTIVLPIAAGGTGNTTGTATHIPNLTGDVTSVDTATTLATVNTNTGAWGSSTAIPVITLDGKGRATAASTAVVIAPAGTLSGTTLNSTVVTSSLTSVGTLTALTVTGTITPSQTNGIVGTNTNNSANAGAIGEIISNTGSGVSLTTGTGANICSVSLTAGDWDVSGVAQFTVGAGTSYSFLCAGITTTTASPVAVGNAYAILYVAATIPGTGHTPALPTPVVRVLLSTTTTVWLAVQADFTVSTLVGAGSIICRRAR